MLPDPTTSPEDWRAVVGWEGWYEVSDLGRIRRVKAATGTSVGHVLGQMLAGQYLRVNLSRGGQSKHRPVHQLVAEAFIGPRPPGQQVNHVIGPKTDNRAVNLEWATPKQNMAHAFALGFAYGSHKPKSGPHARLHGSRNGNAKLTEASVRVIRAARGQRSQRDLARQYGVARSTINAIQHRIRWAHVP